MVDAATGALGGIRAFLLDLDGTVFQNGRLIPGVEEALDELARRGIARRFLIRPSSSEI